MLTTRDTLITQWRLHAENLRHAYDTTMLYNKRLEKDKNDLELKIKAQFRIIREKSEEVARLKTYLEAEQFPFIEIHSPGDEAVSSLSDSLVQDIYDPKAATSKESDNHSLDLKMNLAR